MKYFNFFLVVAFVVTILISCQKENTLTHDINDSEIVESPDNTGTTNSAGTIFNIRMTDGPLMVEEVNIDLELVVIFGSDGQDSIELGTNAGIYNLLDFQNGLDTLIASSTITVDTVKQVRLILGEENTIKVDGVLHDLKTPSAQQSGLKIKMNIPLDNTNVYDLILDFDADASVHQTGNGKYMLKPVIKVL